MPTAKLKKKLDIPPQSLAKYMISLLSDLSDICRNNQWHKSGLHIFIAADEMQKMIDAETITQPMYKIHREGDGNE